VYGLCTNEAMISNTLNIISCCFNFNLINATCNGDITAIISTKGIYQYAVMWAPEIRYLNVDTKYQGNPLFATKLELSQYVGIVIKHTSIGSMDKNRYGFKKRSTLAFKKFEYLYLLYSTM